jgi:hypothetical protein
MLIHAEPDTGSTLKTEFFLFFYENKGTIAHFIPITLPFILFMHNFLSFGCAFPLLFTPF